MGLKTFNLDEATYREFSEHCKKNGISMSKKIENFIKEELEVIKGGTKIMRSRFIREFKEPVNDKEHSFKKYC